jgi:predicted nucleic acid-binding protein
MSEPACVVSDAGPLIHLDELGCLDLLDGLGEILIPHVVWAEVQKHRSMLAVSAIPSARLVPGEPVDAQLLALSKAFDLDAGELAALAVLRNRHGRQLLLCDDSAARLAAESLGVEVRGTIGLIVRALRTKVRTATEVRQTLINLTSLSTLHVSPALLRQVLAQLPAP